MEMRHLFCVVLIIVCNLAVFAQDAPKTEIFAGYSYGNYELLPGSSSVVVDTTTVSGAPSGRLGLNGCNGSVAVNMKRWFSFMTDFSGYYSGSSASTTVTETFSPCASCGTQTTTIVNVASNPRIHNFLFGPQFSYPSGKVRPFAHFLVGGEHVDLTRSENVSGSGIVSTLPAIPASGHVSETGFAMALGGGVDYSIKRNLAWRLQADYLTSQAGLAQNHLRISTGLVWRLGD
jgi:opacity protein-like surface antigen